MYKKIFLGLLVFILPSFLFAHTLILNVDDNEDGTITVEGIFNTGQLAPGAQVRLESLVSGEVLYKKRLPEESELIIEIPKEPYQVVLDAGPGHQMVKEGIAPKGGFSKEVLKKTKEVKVSQAKNAMQNLPFEMIVSVAIAFILLLLTIFISIRNTNKLLKQLKKQLDK